MIRCDERNRKDEEKVQGVYCATNGRLYCRPPVGEERACATDVLLEGGKQQGCISNWKSKTVAKLLFIIMVWLKKIDWIDFVSLSLIFSPSLKPVALNTL
jgi:hypothetical protein